METTIHVRQRAEQHFKETPNLSVQRLQNEENENLPSRYKLDLA